MSNNQDLLANIVVSGVLITFILLAINLSRNIKYRHSAEGKLQKKITENNSALSKISKYEKQSDFVNKDLIQEKKRKISKDIENDILQYKLNSNREFIELQKLKKQGILDKQSFNQAVNNLKAHLTAKPENNIKNLKLENGESLKIEQYYKGTLKNSKLLNHLDIFNNQLVISGNSYFEIVNNKIKNIYKERAYENGFVFAQQNSIISIGDIILKPEKQYDYELIDILSICSVRIKENRVIQVYWIKKGTTLSKKDLKIYQKNKNKRTYNDLVFIDSAKPRDGYHFINILGTVAIIKTKNGMIA